METTAEQYNSLMIEKTVVDRSQADPRFLQILPLQRFCCLRQFGTDPFEFCTQRLSVTV
jgi:hypothetical protein